MSIVSSTHTIGVVQACGRVDVVETHTDHLGTVYSRRYRIASGADYVAIRTAYASVLEQRLADEEASNLIEGAA